MASAITSIWNQALYALGEQQTIEDTTDESPHAEVFRVFWPNARDQFLEMSPWTFAKSSASLTLLSGDAPDSWTYQYVLPTDCIWVTYIEPENAGYKFDYHVISGVRALVCDVEDAIISYTMRLEDVTLWSAEARFAMSLFLALQTEFPITQRPEMSTNILEKFSRAFSAAATGSRNARAPRDPPQTPSIAARST